MILRYISVPLRLISLFYATVMKRISDEQNSDSTASLEDFFDYITALMRSHASENGDDVPIIEFNALKALAFVADAYLSLTDMLEKLDARIALGLSSTENVASDKEVIDMFQNDEASVSYLHLTMLKEDLNYRAEILNVSKCILIALSDFPLF